MKVVLRQDTEGLGKKGDVLDVADGYARNYLIGTGRALRATKGTIAQAESMRRARQLREAKDREDAEAVASALAGTVVEIQAKAGAGGKLFGSVSPADVVEAVRARVGVVLDRRRLGLEEPIRSLGRHEIQVRLHPEVSATLVVEVVASH